ncbi:MAG: 2-iminoacetate synthase ThiH [Bacteroidales bacterium]|jgi:2-iminoacetate synthase|nr:2-iminoacetate synthase ThiH [Bacteroidales bacterium]
MLTFYETIKNLNWEKTTLSINQKTKRDVQIALNKENISLEDFKALLSPAAQPFLEIMAQKARIATQKRYGKIIQFYIPLYLSNECSNHCIYCGFNHNNPIERKTLNDDEIMDEISVIKSMGYDNVLLLTGEYPRVAGIDYIENAVKLCRPHFSTINLEVYPMKIEEYKRLIVAGANSVYVYQETYCEKNYKYFHPKGMKSNYQYRLETPERLSQAGIHRVGLGSLIGLNDWRTEMFFLASHLRFMTHYYWKTKYGVSFPRIRPAEGEFKPAFNMTDKDFAQTIWAFRILDNDVEIAMSTRETPELRNHFISLGITSISAGSKTDPGGYCKPDVELEQFHISDNRSVTEMEKMVRMQGYDVIFKDWDKILN